MGRDAAVTRWGRKALAALAAFALALGLVPAPALADDASAAAATEESGLQLEAGAYVEHEALALVVNDAAAPLARSSASDAFSGAEDLMGVSAEAVSETLGDDAGLTAQARSGVAALAASAVSDDGADAAAEADAAASDARIVLVRDESKTTEELIAELEADPRVICAEPNYTIEYATSDDEALEDAVDAVQDALDGESGSPDDTRGDGSSSAAVDEADEAGDGGADAASGPGAASEASEDDGADSVPAWSDASDLTEFQWEYDNDGTMGGDGSAGVDMGYEGWNASTGTGSDDVVVAVVDTGVDAANPDLADKMWNRSDYPEFESYAIANDLGDEYGYYWSAEGYTSSYTDFPDSTSSHGTHCAGIIAAEWNDSGVSGMSQDARIMGVRATSGLAAILRGYQYIQAAIAYDVPVKVANNSWTLGASQSQLISVSITELGKLGVASVFGSANSATDMDGQAMTAGLLSENPYAVVVDSIDPTGEMSVFSNYGQQTSHVMAPGTTILSTYPTERSQYLGEGDEDAVLYESFDGASHASEAASGAGIKFSAASGAAETTAKSFDGGTAISIPYDPAAAEGDMVWAETEPADLSSVPESERPRFLSLRYSSETSSYPDAQRAARASVQVKTLDGSFVQLDAGQNSFSAYGDSWGGFYVELPDNVDWESFQLRVGVALYAFDMTGGPTVTELVAGNVLVDSIGLGSTLVPYQYCQGTSMAGPAVTGAVAVLAALYPDDSADERAARALGSAEGEDGVDWSAYCRTGGMVSIDAADDPDPVITQVEDEGDTVKVTGWFFGDDAAVTLDGQTATVLSAEPAPAESTDASADPSKTVLSVQKPDGFAGGRVEVSVAAADGGAGRFFAVLAASEGATPTTKPFDETGLPVLDELATWGAWQLAGYNGDVYALPRYDGTSIVYTCILRYSPDEKQWTEISVPQNLLDQEGIVQILDITGATLDGKLVLCLTGATSAGTAAITYMAIDEEGAWSVLTVSQPEADVTTLFGTLVSDGESLYAFGGIDVWEGVESAAIFTVDPTSGTPTEVGSLSSARISPNVAHRDGAFLVAGGISATLQLAAVQGVEILTPGEDGMLAAAQVDTSGEVDETGQLVYGVAATADEFMLAGPLSKDGAADTYTLAADEGATPQAYAKRASEHLLQMTSALAYDGALYVLAGTAEAPYRVFSATAVDTAAQPGDYVAPGPDPDPGPGPDPDPGSGTDPTEDESDGQTLAKLATTGDSLAAPAVAAGATAVAAAALIAAARARRRS